MQITYLGHSCFRLKGRQIAILIDPYAPAGSLKLRKQEADVVLITHEHDDHNHLPAVKDVETVKVFRGPGEYEVKGVFIRGIDSPHDASGGSERGRNTIYVLDLEGVRICHMGDIGSLLEEEVLEEIGPVDILMLPIGGTYTINASEAAEMTKLISPRVVIPMHFREEGYAGSETLLTVDDFIKADGTAVERMDTLVLTSTAMPEGKKIVVLQRG